MTTPDDPFRKGEPYAPPHGQPSPQGGQQGPGGQPGYGAPQGQPYPPQPYGPQGYGPPAGYQGQPGWAPAYGPQETASRAIVALVLSIASFVVFPLVPAIAALFLAKDAEREIAGSGGRLTGEGMATAARVLAWINIALCAIVSLAVVALVVGVLNGPSFG